MRLLDAAQQVAEQVGVRRDEVHPVLCLLGETPEDSWSHGVDVCGAVNLTETLMLRRERLGSDEVDAIAQTLERSTRSAGGTGRTDSGQVGLRQDAWHGLV